MNRIDNAIQNALKSGKKIFSPYITVGDLSLDITLDLMHALVAQGADILELGLPFSDPMAEGPVLQAAMERALANNVTYLDAFVVIKKFREKDNITPIILMGYLNPIEQCTCQSFAYLAKGAGVDGTIIVDLPPEESDDIDEYWAKEELYNIYLCSPTTSDARMKLINKKARGYLYYVSIKGVTGAEGLDVNQLKVDYLQRKSQTQLPLLVGFGIKNPNIAAKIAEFADGIIVGAALNQVVYNAYKDHDDPIHAGALFAKNLCSFKF